MKVARTVLRGGKTERSYLSQQKVAGSNPATLTFNLLAISLERKCQDSRPPSAYLSLINIFLSLRFFYSLSFLFAYKKKRKRRRVHCQYTHIPWKGYMHITDAPSC